MTCIFISHSNDEDTLANPIFQRLRAAGFDAWTDHTHCTGIAEDCLRQVREAIMRCDVGLLVLTPRSAASSDCCDEWQEILRQGKPLYIAEAIKVPENELPQGFPILERIDLTQDFNRGMQQLIAEIRANHNLQQAGAA
jgi:hypothetical protein